MKIRKRMGLPRQYLHVMNRGARKLTIFTDDQDRALFVRLLGRFAIKHDVSIISWCLMSNHAHLEPETEGTPLCSMMHDLEGTYARAFNKRHGTSGCIFQGPFVCTEISDAKGLAYVSRYIHLNPYPLGVSPLTYRWSSVRSYLGLAWTPEWLNPQPVLSLMGTDRQGQIEGYRRYLGEAPKRRRKRRRMDAFGDFFMEFMRHLEERFTERLIMTHGQLGGVSPRSLLAWAARRIYEVPIQIVSQYLGYADVNSVSVVARRVEQRLEVAPHLRNMLEAR
jgi:putative transposase